MNRYIIEVTTPNTAPEVLDYFKANGGHANLINVRPPLTPERVPAYVSEPYLPEAYEIAKDPIEVVPDCPYCDGTGAVPGDQRAAIEARHPDWSVDEVTAEVARTDGELQAPDARWVRERERIQAEMAAQG